jgi:YegS C-terminal NAD kinase beta sandwich-like domain
VTGPIRHGQPWGHPATSPPDIEVVGDDADLAAAMTRHPGVLARFRPSPESDVARALGLDAEAAGATEVALDALEVDVPSDRVRITAVNAVVVGRPPDRLRRSTRSASIRLTIDGRPWFAGRGTTVVVASGQFLRGADLVPRGHPGDGWLEVQVYALPRRERRPMRRRLLTGTHVPHPSIQTTRARHVEIEIAGGAVPLEVDGRPHGRTARLSATVVPEAIRLLV